MKLYLPTLPCPPPAVQKRQSLRGFRASSWLRKLQPSSDKHVDICHRKTDETRDSSLSADRGGLLLAKQPRIYTHPHTHATTWTRSVRVFTVNVGGGKAQTVQTEPAPPALAPALHRFVYSSASLDGSQPLSRPPPLRRPREEARVACEIDIPLPLVQCAVAGFAVAFPAKAWAFAAIWDAALPADDVDHPSRGVHRNTVG